jgi:hypothetical protein
MSSSPREGGATKQPIREGPGIPREGDEQHKKTTNGQVETPYDIFLLFLRAVSSVQSGRVVAHEEKDSVRTRNYKKNRDVYGGTKRDYSSEWITRVI